MSQSADTQVGMRLSAAWLLGAHGFWELCPSPSVPENRWGLPNLDGTLPPNPGYIYATVTVILETSKQFNKVWSFTYRMSPEFA